MQQTDTEDPQILLATLPNLVPAATWHSGSVHRRSTDKSRRIILASSEETFCHWVRGKEGCCSCSQALTRHCFRYDKLMLSGLFCSVWSGFSVISVYWRRSYALQPCKKVKQSHYRPGQALRIPGGWDFKAVGTRSGRIVSPTHRPPLPLENIPGTHFC
jgi:hypothetical protein